MTTKYSAKTAMKHRGYTPIAKIATTLQGSVWTATSKTNEECIIKVTSIKLSNASVALIDGKLFPVEEDIIKEASVQKYLTINNPPNALTRYIDFFCDKRNYFLVQENGGSSLFNFVTKCHQLILDGRLKISEWQSFCQETMKQIIELIDWMHNLMNCVHLDLSLENFTISDVMVSVDKLNRIKFLGKSQVKLIDFGLSEVFEPNKNGVVSFESRKYVGKAAYKAPKVFARKESFDSRKADVWSLGVILFSMLTGASLYQKPKRSDIAFKYVIDGLLADLVKSYKREHYVTSLMLDLMVKIFRSEQDRISIKDIKHHKWFSDA